MKIATTMLVLGAIGCATYARGTTPLAKATPRINPTRPPNDRPKGMEHQAWIPGGLFAMGCAGCNLADALPVHWVEIDGFWLDETPVSNDEFRRFAVAKDYATLSERQPSPAAYPGVPPDKLVAGSGVFVAPDRPVALFDAFQWWQFVPGASWRHPRGPGTDLKGLGSHPAVHIGYDDAVAYCAALGRRLPTEAEYEFAARGGLHAKRYSWGDELKPMGKWAANIWQGRFPDKNSADDGYAWTSPVKAFPPNGFGLYDMGGNVWQWVSDWYRPDYFAQLAASGQVSRNPQGPGDSQDPEEPGVKKRVLRGGSFLCSDHYCTRFLVGSRGKAAPDSGGSNTGFRCATSTKR